MISLSIFLTILCAALGDTTQARISTTTEVPLTPPPPAFSQISPFPEQCGNQSITLPSRILGGNEVSLTEFPWMARLRHRSASGFYTFGCAGFLISEYFVMTAAHCIASKTLTTLGPMYVCPPLFMSCYCV
uniref:Peptidase S1 domain-containing protein n=1 Tax=Photinus pyralis TaxID=7054 RepID=A0A1Y1KLC6_PHOPY